MNISIEQIDPFSLPSVELGQRDQLPQVSAVYFAILDTEILYIGKSVNLYQRWQGHHRINQLKSLGNVIIAWVPFINLEGQDLRKFEEECIVHFRPLLNGEVIRTAIILTGEVLFGQRLRQLRKRQGITQEHLAEAVAVDVRTIQRWEGGDTGPEFNKLEKIAHFLKVSLKDLFDFSAL